jgi:hypothetical protein
LRADGHFAKDGYKNQDDFYFMLDSDFGHLWL